MAEQLTFQWNTSISPRGDGTFILKPSRPLLPQTFCDTREVMARTGLRHSQARALMTRLGAQQLGPHCRLRVERTALERALERHAGES